MKRRHKLILTSAGLAFLCGCQTAADRAAWASVKHREQLSALAESTEIDTSDGISETEAFRIGQDRFATYHSVCGAVTLPKEVDGIWHITILFGAAALPVEHIAIRKSDGEMTITNLRQKQEPIQPPQALRSALRSDRSA